MSNSPGDDWIVRPSDPRPDDDRLRPPLDDLLPGVPRRDSIPPPHPDARPPSIGRVAPTRAHGLAAGVVTRGIARFLDGIVASFLIVFVNFALAAIALPDATVFRIGGQAFTFVTVVVSFVVPVAYHVYYEVGNGQSIGKRWLSITVKNDEDQRPTMQQSVVRNAVVAATAIPGLGLLLLLGIVVSMSRNDRHRGLHDQLAGTTVVRAM